MCMSLYDYHSKASIYSYGLANLKTRVTTNQKNSIDSQKPKKKKDSQKPKRREHINNTKEIKPQKEKLKEKEKRRNTKSPEKKV